jgi:carbon starvation protein
VPGAVWPFVCVVIMCGALSGFHALVSSGTTPKMLDRESDMRAIGYGAMLLEAFVSLMALVAACALEPGEYFKINIPQDRPAQIARYHQVVEHARAEHAWEIGVPDEQFAALERSTGEKNLAGKVGGAVTLAVGMAKVFARLPGMRTLTEYWYHFVIMFEALFILTLLETGARVARYVFQETVDQFRPRRSAERHAHWTMNTLASVVVCAAWGYLVYSGDIASLWRMMGIANQLLAVIALSVGTTYLLRYSSRRAYALCTGIPWALVVVTVFTAGEQSIQNWWSELGDPALAAGDAFWVRLMSLLAGTMLALTAVVVVDAIRRWVLILAAAPEPAAELAVGKPTDTP